MSLQVKETHDDDDDDNDVVVDDDDDGDDDDGNYYDHGGDDIIVWDALSSNSPASVLLVPRIVSFQPSCGFSDCLCLPACLPVYLSFCHVVSLFV